MSDRLVRPVAGLLAALLAVVLVPAGFAAAQAPATSQLAEARDRLAAVERELDDATSDADSADDELADADERLAEVESIVNDVAAQLDRQRGAVADATGRLDAVEADAAVIRAQLEDRVTSMFKHGAVRDFDVLLASDGAEEALARSTFLRVLTVGDSVTAETLAAAEVAVGAERERLQVEEDRLDDLLVEQEELLGEVERIRESRALAAADARARVEQLAAEQDDLEAESAELEQLIRTQQREARDAAAAEEAAAAERERAAAAERAAAPPASSGSGSGSGSSDSGGGGGDEATTSAPSSSGYAWPICAPVTSEYGQRWGRLHAGIDQGASTGTAIGASKAGTVIFAGWQGGYGNLVLIDHGDGVVTAYAHQSSMAVGNGASVSQGQTIGYVGNTGNSTGPHLHFETRVNGSAVNPRNYLSGGPC